MDLLFEHIYDNINSFKSLMPFITSTNLYKTVEFINKNDSEVTLEMKQAYVLTWYIMMYNSI